MLHLLYELADKHAAIPPLGYGSIDFVGFLVRFVHRGSDSQGVFWAFWEPRSGVDADGAGVFPAYGALRGRSSEDTGPGRPASCKCRNFPLS